MNMQVTRAEAANEPFHALEAEQALIAAERTGRVARLIELDPEYVDVIVKRWEAFTGKKAVFA